MNIEEIRKNAPDDATGYILHNEKIFYYLRNFWMWLELIQYGWSQNTTIPQYLIKKKIKPLY